MQSFLGRGDGLTLDVNMLTEPSELWAIHLVGLYSFEQLISVPWSGYCLNVSENSIT